MSQSELDQLLNVQLPLVDDMLRKYGEAYPLGAGMDLQGQVQLIAARTQPGQQVTTAQLLEHLRQFFLQNVAEGKFKAISLSFDSLVVLPGSPDQRDAITVFLEDAEGSAMLIYRPYKKELDGQITYDQLYGLHSTPEFFNVGKAGAPGDAAPITSPATYSGPAPAPAPAAPAAADSAAPPADAQPRAAGLGQLFASAPPPPAGKPPVVFGDK